MTDSVGRQLGARGTNAVLGVDPSNEMLRRGVVKAGRRRFIAALKRWGFKGFSPSKNGNVPICSMICF
jgi:hypothetical protein